MQSVPWKEEMELYAYLTFDLVLLLEEGGEQVPYEFKDTEWSQGQEVGDKRQFFSHANGSQSPHSPVFQWPTASPLLAL